MPSQSRLYVRHRVIREEAMDDVLFLIDEQEQAIHMLDGISPGLWNLLGEPVSITDAKRILKIAFPGVPAKRVARDVENLFEELDAAGLITHAA